MLFLSDGIRRAACDTSAESVERSKCGGPTDSVRGEAVLALVEAHRVVGALPEDAVDESGVVAEVLQSALECGDVVSDHGSRQSVQEYSRAELIRRLAQRSIRRLADDAVARAKARTIVRPPGQSDSSRLDQTVATRVTEDQVDLVTAIVSMMPPAWENDERLSPAVRAMLEYFSLREEKNDGPAALVFADGDVVGARLDRLGLRPLRTVETDEYLCISSEAGQIAFDPATERRRGRIEAGGMIYFDHRDGTVRGTVETLEMLAARHDYAALLDQARIPLADLPELPAMSAITSITVWAITSGMTRPQRWYTQPNTMPIAMLPASGPQP